jgi:hypothetical protein
MNSKTLVASQDDYVKFKKLLQFFVWQSSKNADNGRAESPSRINPKFMGHYELEPEFNKIADLDFMIRFFMVGRFNTELSTYINIRLLNIIGKFEKGKIVALRNLIKLDIPSISISGDLRKRCEERNEQLKYYSLEELGIEKDCPSEKISEALKSVKDANDSLKKMFDEYLKIYKDFYEEIEQAVSQPKEKHSSITLEQEMNDFIEKFKEDMAQAMQSDIEFSAISTLYHYTNLTALKKIVESKKLWATHIKYLNDKGEIKYVLDNIFFPAIDCIIPAIDDIYEQIQKFLKRLKNDIAKQFSIDLYVTSFSTKRDMLSQWRGYSKGYDSVCIGFDAKRIIENPGNRIGIFKVEYEDDEEKLTTYLSGIYNVLSKHPNEEISNEQYLSLLEILFIFFAKTKHPSWREEQECRLIYESKWKTNGERIEPEFRIDKGKGYLIPYMAEDIYEISEIILPQSDNFESIKIAIKKLLKKNGLNENIEIKESEIPIAYDTPSTEFLEAFNEPPI